MSELPSQPIGKLRAYRLDGAMRVKPKVQLLLFERETLAFKKLRPALRRIKVVGRR